MPATESLSLAEIARRYDVSPQLVAKWRKKAEQKYGSLTATPDPLDKRVARYSGEDLRRILEFATRSPIHKPVIELVAEPVDIQTTEIVPFVGGQFDIQAAIVNLDGALGESLDQAESVVQAVELITDKVASGLEAKVAKQRQELEKTEDQLNRIDASRRIFKRRTTIAAQESKALATEQTEASKDLQVKAQEIFSLGKSPQSSQLPRSE